MRAFPGETGVWIGRTAHGRFALHVGEHHPIGQGLQRTRVEGDGEGELVSLRELGQIFLLLTRTSELQACWLWTPGLTP